MLSEAQIELLTAYVDGELSQRQRKAVRRLLERWPEARALVSQLYDDAQKLRNLPRRKVQPSLAPDVLQAIAESGLPLTRSPVPRARRRWRPYAAAMLAASLLLVVGGGVLYLISDGEESPLKGSGGTIAVIQPAPQKRTTPEREMPAPRKLPNPLIAAVTDGVYKDFVAPIPPERDPVLSIAFREMGKELTSDKIAAQLDRDRSVQLDITVKNNPVAMERLQRALDGSGIKVIIDPEANRTLKKNPAKVEYLVYAENLRTDELTRILRELSRDDSTLQQNAKSPFEKVTLSPLTAKEKKQVSGLLGVEPSKMELAEPKKNDASPPTFKNWERQAVVLPLSQPGRPSQEVQRFASQRRPRPGTLQVLVRIHQEK